MGWSSNATRSIGLVALVVALVALGVWSLAVGARTLPLSVTWHHLFHADASPASTIVRDLRFPRTVLAIVVGAALGLAGALLQALTRNPLADPGILGINAGAAAGVVVGIAYWHFATLSAYVWCAFVGAAVASVLVYVIGAGGRRGTTPVRLVLAGMAIAASLTAVVTGIVLTRPGVFEAWRSWTVGSFSGRELSVSAQVAPFLVVGVLVGLVVAGPLDALSLGEDTGRSLGAHLGWTRGLTALSVTLLCGAATAAVGPIAFVGLAVPHVARMIVGPNQRWVFPYSLVLGALMLLGADMIGRIVVRPGELQASVVVAVVGAPVFIALVRRRKPARL